MYTFLARQPIFDAEYNVYGYELLYRNAENSLSADLIDGTSATKRVLSDAITLFGLNTLTNSKPAFVNFTEELILEGFPFLAGSKDIVVELLEDIKITPKVMEAVRKLKKQGYTIALDDYLGDPCFDDILPYVDIVKVDFIQTDRTVQEDIVKELSNKTILLAEKVETNEEYEWAKSIGYKLFQGYFFAKPSTYKEKSRDISSTTFFMLMDELSKEDFDFARCSDIVRTDSVLTYKLLQKMKTMEYFRGHTINKVENAISMMGLRNFKHWLILIVSKDVNSTTSDELIRAAYLRGLYAESLMKKSSKASESQSGFLVGMFSLVDKIFGKSMEELLENIAVSEELKDALLGRADNIYSQLLRFIVDYEKQNNTITLQELGTNISQKELHKIYADCIMKADSVFTRTC